jgi:hypothetical protein
MSVSTSLRPAEVFPEISAVFAPESAPPSPDELSDAIALYQTIREWVDIVALEAAARIEARTSGDVKGKGRQIELSPERATDATEVLAVINAQKEKGRIWDLVLKAAVSVGAD